MTDKRLTYNCPECGYTNVWTRDEILHQGKVQVHRGDPSILVRDDEDRYSLPCKNTITPACSGRFVVALKRRKE